MNPKPKEFCNLNYVFSYYLQHSYCRESSAALGRPAVAEIRVMNKAFVSLKVHWKYRVQPAGSSLQPGPKYRECSMYT